MYYYWTDWAVRLADSRSLSLEKTFSGLSSHFAFLTNNNGSISYNIKWRMAFYSDDYFLAVLLALHDFQKSWEVFINLKFLFNFFENCHKTIAIVEIVIIVYCALHVHFEYVKASFERRTTHIRSCCYAWVCIKSIDIKSKCTFESCRRRHDCSSGRGDGAIIIKQSLRRQHKRLTICP